MTNNFSDVIVDMRPVLFIFEDKTFGKSGVHSETVETGLSER